MERGVEKRVTHPYAILISSSLTYVLCAPITPSDSEGKISFMQIPAQLWTTDQYLLGQQEDLQCLLISIYWTVEVEKGNKASCCKDGEILYSVLQSFFLGTDCPFHNACTMLFSHKVMAKMHHCSNET